METGKYSKRNIGMQIHLINNNIFFHGKSVIYQAIPNAQQYSIQAATQFNPTTTPQFAVAQLVRADPLTSATSLNTDPFNNRSSFFQSTPAIMVHAHSSLSINRQLIADISFP